jgi:hypothetical protein
MGCKMGRPYTNRTLQGAEKMLSAGDYVPEPLDSLTIVPSCIHGGYVS